MFHFISYLRVPKCTFQYYKVVGEGRS